MFIITKRLTRTRAVIGVLLLGVFLAGLILLAAACQRRAEEPILLAGTGEERLAFLSGLGWQVEESPVETLYLQLPQDFAGTEYEAYNVLQQSQGFDLTPCAGQQVVRYTYRVLNYPGRTDAVQLNLFCCEGFVVAGDVIAPGENGFQSTLVFPEEE